DFWGLNMATAQPPQGSSASSPKLETRLFESATIGLLGRSARPATPFEFAHHVRESCKQAPCDFLLSLERIWECDAYRAGDGVHASWLERRARFEPRWRPFLRRFNRKHREILQ